MMAGSGVPGDQILVEQARLIALAGGVSKEKADENAATQRECSRWWKPKRTQRRSTRNCAKSWLPMECRRARSARRSTLSRGRGSAPSSATILRRHCARLRARCWPSTAHSTCKFRPRKSARHPQSAARGGNKHYEVDELPGLNHLFQTAKTGAPGEYGEIEETMSPVALDKMGGWILKQ